MDVFAGISPDSYVLMRAEEGMAAYAQISSIIKYVNDNLILPEPDKRDPIPIGLIVPSYSKGDSEDGLWVVCDGRELPKEEYDKLYSVLGATYGESDIGFNIPDYRSRFLMGNAATTHVQGEITEQTIETHKHGIKSESQSGAHTHQFTKQFAQNGIVYGYPGTGAYSPVDPIYGNVQLGRHGDHTHNYTISSPVKDPSSSESLPVSKTEVLPNSMIVNYRIRIA